MPEYMFAFTGNEMLLWGLICFLLGAGVESQITMSHILRGLQLPPKQEAEKRQTAPGEEQCKCREIYVGGVPQDLTPSSLGKGDQQQRPSAK